MSGLSDHIVVITRIKTSYANGRRTKQSNNEPHVVYKWMEGSQVSDYANSAKSWQAFTQKTDFLKALETLITSTDKNNDDRAAAVEEYIVQ
jgi:hypothetical protein